MHSFTLQDISYFRFLRQIVQGRPWLNSCVHPSSEEQFPLSLNLSIYNSSLSLRISICFNVDRSFKCEAIFCRSYWIIQYMLWIKECGTTILLWTWAKLRFFVLKYKKDWFGRLFPVLNRVLLFLRIYFSGWNKILFCITVTKLVHKNIVYSHKVIYCTQSARISIYHTKEA